MKMWECTVYSDKGLTRPVVSFTGRFRNADRALQALQEELAAVQVVLFPGNMNQLEASTPLEDEQFKMIRFNADDGMKDHML